MEKEKRQSENRRRKPVVYHEDKYLKYLEMNHRESVDLYLSHCGKADCMNGYVVGPKKIEDYMVYYVLSGKGTYHVSGREYHLQEKDFFLIRAGDCVSYIADDKDPWSVIWLAFNGVKARSFINYAGLDNVDRLVGRCEEKALMEACADQILMANTFTHVNELRKIGYLYLFLAKLIDGAMAEQELKEYQYPNRQYVRYIMEYIERNYQKPVKINDIAESVGLNRSYMTSVFKNTMGESPKEYLVRFRLEKAEKLLEETHMKLQDIAEAVGYPDALSLSRAFKDKNQMSPSNYRKKFGKQNKN